MGLNSSKLENLPQQSSATPDIGSFSKQENVSTEKATLGGGCFWCIEAVFQRIKGVTHVESGYAGGNTRNTTYNEVIFGNTGHAEVIQVTFNPQITQYQEILKIYFLNHDPTTLNKQGPDVGTQYRSVIFYHNEGQRLTAERVKEEIQASNYYKGKIVTQILPLRNYVRAEDYHQNYYNQNPYAAYCQRIIKPKLDKLMGLFKDKVQNSL